MRRAAAAGAMRSLRFSLLAVIKLNLRLLESVRRGAAAGARGP